MISTKGIIAGLIGGLVALVMGAIIFGFVLNDFMANAMKADISRDSANIVWWAMVAGHLCIGFLFAYIYEVHTNIRSFAKGASAGAVIGLLMAGIFNLIDYGSLNTMSLTGEIVDLIVVGLVSSIVGGLVAYILGR